MNDEPKRVRRTKSQMAKPRAQANLDTLVAVKLGEARAAKATPSQPLGRPRRGKPSANHEAPRAG